MFCNTSFLLVFPTCTNCSFDSRIKVSPNGTITIHSVTERDSGDYLCSARNKMGDDYVLLRVNVLTRPAKIKHDQQQPSQEVVYGGDLKVDCVASGLPNPEISWALPDGTMVNPDKQEHGFGGGRSRRYELPEILIAFHSMILSLLYCRL